MRKRASAGAKALRVACVCALACGPWACAQDDGAPRDAGMLDAASDASAQDAAGIDAGATLDASLGEDAGGADAGDAGPEVIRGEDYVLYPSLQPEADGQLVIDVGVPRGARSFAFTVVPASPRRVQLIDLRGPDGELIFDGLADEPTGPLARAFTRNVADELPFSMLYPNTPQAPWAPGRYRVRMYLADPAEGADTRASVDIVFGRPVAEDAVRSLELRVWVARGASIDAADVAADAALVAAFDELRAIFASHGIQVGDIAVEDLGADDAMLGLVDGDAALAALTAELDGLEGQAAHLVFVDRLELGAGATVLGKSTGMPGPPGHAALDRRGAVVIGLETLPSDPARVAELFAHELGHYLGLRHTSEADGLRHDPLADTAECPAERATFTTTSGAIVLSAEDCEDLDGTNLLFYTPPRTSFEQRTLSADQSFVIRVHPTVR